MTQLGLGFRSSRRGPRGCVSTWVPTRTRALLAGSATPGAAARCALRPHHPSPSQRRRFRVTERVSGRAPQRTYLPGSQAQGGHLSAVVELQMAGHDRRTLRKLTRYCAALGPALTFK